MKKLFILLAVLIPLAGIGQVSVTKVGDQIKFTGLGLGNGAISSTAPYDQIYASGIDQVLIKGDIMYFVNSGSKSIVAQVPFSKLTDKLGQTTPRLYVEHLIAEGFFNKAVTLQDQPIDVVADTITVNKVLNQLPARITNRIALRDGTDSTKTATIATRGSTTSMNTTIIDATGNPVSSFGGADQDKTTFALGTDKGTVIEGVATTDAVAAGQKAALSIMLDRALRTYETSPNWSMLGTIQSPDDFQATYASAYQLAVSQANKTFDNTTTFILGIAYLTSGGSVVRLENGKNGVAISIAANTISVTVNGVNYTGFAATDVGYRVTATSQQKAFDKNLQILKTVDQSPESSRYRVDVWANVTNQSATTYWPGASGFSMDGFADLTLSGKMIEGDAVNDSLYVQVTNDATFTDWHTIYGYDPKNNTTVNQFKQTGIGTLLWTIVFPNLNYKYVRIVYGTGDATNSLVIRARRKAM